MKKPKPKVVVGTHTWRAEVKPWSEPIDYEAWKVAVCGERVADETRLQEYYAACWEPADCAEYLSINKMLHKPAKKIDRVVTLGIVDIERRFALCLWRECSKLMTRRMTPEARVLVCDTQARMEASAGIERLA